jgi:hypothetical protein
MVHIALDEVKIGLFGSKAEVFEAKDDVDAIKPFWRI